MRPLQVRGKKANKNMPSDNHVKSEYHSQFFTGLSRCLGMIIDLPSETKEHCSKFNVLIDWPWWGIHHGSSAASWKCCKGSWWICHVTWLVFVVCKCLWIYMKELASYWPFGIALTTMLRNSIMKSGKQSLSQLLESHLDNSYKRILANSG